MIKNHQPTLEINIVEDYLKLKILKIFTFDIFCKIFFVHLHIIKVSTMEKQHIQLPNDMTINQELSPKDLLIYVTIKSYMNSATKECYPSLDTIVKKSGISKPTVRKSIDNLKKLKYIEVRIQGRKNVYKFNKYKNFEPFSYEFLNSDLDPNLKAYIIATQQSMFKDIEGYGKISYSDTQLSQIINLDRHTIAKYNKTLEEKGFLSIVPTNNKDNETGLKTNEKIFHLNELGQQVIWALQKHENDINELKETTSNTSKEVKMLLDEINKLKKQINGDEITL